MRRLRQLGGGAAHPLTTSASRPSPLDRAASRLFVFLFMGNHACRIAGAFALLQSPRSGTACAQRRRAAPHPPSARSAAARRRLNAQRRPASAWRHARDLWGAPGSGSGRRLLAVDRRLGGETIDPPERARQSRPTASFPVRMAWHGPPRPCNSSGAPTKTHGGRSPCVSWGNSAARGRHTLERRVPTAGARRTGGSARRARWRCAQGSDCGGSALEILAAPASFPILTSWASSTRAPAGRVSARAEPWGHYRGRAHQGATKWRPPAPRCGVQVPRPRRMRVGTTALARAIASPGTKDLCSRLSSP